MTSPQIFLVFLSIALIFSNLFWWIGYKDIEKKFFEAKDDYQRANKAALNCESAWHDILKKFGVAQKKLRSMGFILDGVSNKWVKTNERLEDTGNKEG